MDHTGDPEAIVGEQVASWPAGDAQHSWGAHRPAPTVPSDAQQYARRDVSDAVGVSLLSARRFWHALGLPRISDDDVAFTDTDVAALDVMVSLVRSGRIDEATALALTRAMAQTADRLASWQAQLIRELVESRVGAGVDVAPGTSPDVGEVERRSAQLLEDLATDMEPLVVYAWRRHLAAAVSQLAAQAQVAPDGPEHVHTVGFADMVNFTELVRRLSETELSHLVQRFEAVATDTVAAYGGRVVKTIGDEVLFTAHEPVAAAGIALALHEAVAADRDLPPLRIGLATGVVIARQGDIYGTTVNLAARLTALARPGTTLANGDLAQALVRLTVGHEEGTEAVGAGRLTVRPMRTRSLRGLGPTRPFVVRPGPLGGPMPLPRRSVPANGPGAPRQD